MKQARSHQEAKPSRVVCGYIDQQGVPPSLSQQKRTPIKSSHLLVKLRISVSIDITALKQMLWYLLLMVEMRSVHEIH